MLEVSGTTCMMVEQWVRLNELGKGDGCMGNEAAEVGHVWQEDGVFASAMERSVHVGLGVA